MSRPKKRDMLVDEFANAMKAKLDRSKRVGWNAPWFNENIIIRRLQSEVNTEYVDPVDVANYAAFLWNKQGRPRDV
jgi:hypothetical protein